MTTKNVDILRVKIGSAGRALLLLIGAAIVAASGPVSADNGRDFAGPYEATNVTQSGDSYSLTFTARVFNYSGADVTNATLSLVDSVQPDQTYATFSSVSISSGDNALITASATVPAREYQSWQNGSQPRLTIAFTDSSGTNRLEVVELGPGPVGEGQ